MRKRLSSQMLLNFKFTWVANSRYSESFKLFRDSIYVSVDEIVGQGVLSAFMKQYKVPRRSIKNKSASDRAQLVPIGKNVDC